LCYANEQNRIESEYLRLVSESPTCPDAVYVFAKFLREIKCDQHKATYWEELGSYLEHSSEVCDLCHAQGMAVFPGLPQQPSYQADEQPLGMNNRFLSAGSLLDVTGELDERRRQHQATIRDLAMRAPLTFIVVLRIATVLHFVLFVLFVCFMPIIPIRNVLELVRVSWANVRDADAVATHLTQIKILIATDIAYIAEMMLNSSGEPHVIGSDPDPDPLMTDHITMRAAELNEALDRLINGIADSIMSSGDA
jgi:hypothetical protein